MHSQLMFDYVDENYRIGHGMWFERSFLKFSFAVVHCFSFHCLFGLAYEMLVNLKRPIELWY